ncbi:hypothetical protein J1614_007825 [Plenodomus biglobosus]|nr:hypothetical protein J1614_007825 [Plenodomus biglobosus]
MPSPRDEYIMVRRRNTGLIDVRRANEFSRQSGIAAPEYILHYIGVDRSRVCRCKKPNEHYEQTISVAAEATHLNVSLMMYLARHDIESCTIAAFKKYMYNRKAIWRKQGVNIDTFHYMSDAKDKVCRCSTPTGHHTGAPRNPDIVEQCAQFFISNQDTIICRRHEWRGVEGDSPPVYSSPIQSSDRPTSALSPNLSQPPYSPDPQRGTSACDSQSPQKFLKDWTERTAASPEMKVRLTAEPFTPMYAQGSPSGRHGESDIPEKVWESARPSVYIPLHRSDSVVSTPLGTAFSQTLTSATSSSQFKASGVTNDLQRASVITSWSMIQDDADRLGDNSFNARHTNPIQTTKRLVSQSSHCTIKPEYVHKGLENISLQDSTARLDIACPQRYDLGCHTHESDFTNNIDPHATLPAELSDQVNSVELEAETRHHARYHTTAHEIHDGRPSALFELPGERSSLHASHKPSNMSTSTRPSSQLSSHIEQVHDDVRLPDQEELLLRHAAVSSHANSPPIGDCTICKEPYQDRKRRSIMLPGCEHFVHEDCLLESFRIRDQRIGTCPVCNIGICERTLTDRIATDRVAIFGSQFTQLRNHVSIEFPLHNELVTCASEEQVAATQLRLIKDYVDVNSEENFRMWELNRAEPDWFMGIIRPVVKLFQAWDVPDRQSRFFVGHDSFLKVLAWAELVRLMNNGRKSLFAAQGKDAMYPQLAELHHKFALALERYDKEKLLWGEDQNRVPECDHVAQYVVHLAMRIQSA